MPKVVMGARSDGEEPLVIIEMLVSSPPPPIIGLYGVLYTRRPHPMAFVDCIPVRTAKQLSLLRSSGHLSPAFRDGLSAGSVFCCAK